MYYNLLQFAQLRSGSSMVLRVGVAACVCAYVSMRQHASSAPASTAAQRQQRSVLAALEAAYVSKQAAYVSIRQHTGSIR